MLRFFDYCFYRITYSKYYQRVDKKDPYIWAWGWISLCQTFNVLSIIIIYYLIIDTKFNFKLVCIPIYLTIYFLNIYCFLPIKKYKEMGKLEKNEKYRKLKGWGVILYILLSFAIFGFVMVKLFWVPTIK